MFLLVAIGGCIGQRGVGESGNIVDGWNPS